MRPHRTRLRLIAATAAISPFTAATFDDLEPSDGAVGIRDTTATFTIDVQ
jgi:hypothetical protein